MLLIELGREPPHSGCVKEETNPIVFRMKKLLAAKPKNALFNAKVW